MLTTMFIRARHIFGCEGNWGANGNCRCVLYPCCRHWLFMNIVSTAKWIGKPPTSPVNRLTSVLPVPPHNPHISNNSFLFIHILIIPESITCTEPMDTELVKPV